MHAYRLNHETCRSLSRVTRPCRPGALSNIRLLGKSSRSTSLLTTPTHCHHICDRDTQRRFYSSVFAPRNDPTNTPARNGAAEEVDHNIDERELPSLAELQRFEAELLSEFEDELRQAIEEGQLESEDQSLEETYDKVDPMALPTSERHENTVDAVLAQRTFGSIEEAHDAVLRALDNKQDPFEALFTFFRAAQVPNYLESISAAFVQDVMDVIKPDNLLLPYRDIHHNLHPDWVARSRHQSLERVNAIYYELVELLLVQIQYSKQRPQAWLLKMLLDITRVCGWDRQARIVFRTLKELPGQQADLESYNKYFEALCWGNAYSSTEKFGLKVTPAIIALRDTTTGEKTSGYRTGEGGLKDEVLATFKQLQDQGLAPDATSYTNLMIALAREGQIDEVKWVLQHVWDVDCDKILQGHDEEPFLENVLGKDSPLYPTSDTLFALAHVFSINGDMSAAIRVVGFFATKYSLQITDRTWVELLEWSHVYSSRYNTLDRKRPKRRFKGPVPPSAVMDLWTIMRSPPYEVKLNMDMIHFLIKNCVRRDSKVHMIRLMLEGDHLARRSYFVFREFKRNQHKVSSHGEVMEDLQTLRMFRDHSLMVKFLRYLLAASDERRMRNLHRRVQIEWFYRTLPDVMGRFWKYKTADGNAYDIPGGRVQFHRSETAINLTPADVRIDGNAVLQSPLPLDLGLYTGMTRQIRLQLRHILRGFGGTRPPRWTPAYYDATDDLAKRNLLSKWVQHEG